MEAIAEQVELNIDKSAWTPVKLFELAEEISERADNPAQSKYGRFVGLEHFVSGDLKLKSWGSTKDLGSSMKVFKAGDILFARRNAYLRRASLVEFDGICSGDAFVLRENHEKVVPGFLAFVLNSDALWDYANSNAAGTMSKRVKWRDLGEYKFLLPPQDQQVRLAELLWAADEVVETSNNLLLSLKDLRVNLFNASLFKASRKPDQAFGNMESLYPVENLGELITELQYGISQSLEDPTGIPVLRMNNLQDGELLLGDLKYYQPKGDELARFMLNRGDLLFNRTNSFELVGKVSLFDVDGEYSFASYLIRIATNRKKINPVFLNHYLNSPIGMAKVRSHRTPGVSQSNINAQNLKLIPVPVPDMNIQNLILDKVEAISKSEKAAKLRIHSTKNLQKSLINQMF